MQSLPCLLLAAFAANASGQLPSDSTPVVEVFLPPVLRSESSLAFNKAKEVATEIYAAIGVKLVWPTKGRRPVGCANQPMHGTILVRFQESNSRPDNGRTLAWSNPYLKTGPCVTLLIDRVTNDIRLNPMSAPLVLGHTLAHEIGHVLEGVARHSDFGLMKAHWPTQEVLAVMQYERLKFTTERT